MITNDTKKFPYYVIFSLTICATMLAVNQYLVPQPTTEVSHNTKAKKTYSMEEKAGQVSDKPLVAEVDFSNPKFKKQIKLNPKFKEASTSIKTPVPTSETQESSEKPAGKTTEKNTLNDANFLSELKALYQANVLDKLGKEKHRKDIIIRYYTHAPDGKKVYALRKLGFYIHERPVEGSLDDYESNAIFYGDEVTKEDLQMVVYTLLQQGLPIKRIAPSQFHDSWKSSSIEIGTDTTATRLPVVLMDQIQHMSL